MVQLLLFSVDEILAGIPLADTSHVIRMVRLTEKPDALPWEAGTINHHGKQVPVISIRVLLGRAAMYPLPTDMLIIARTGNQDIALWVDATSGVQDIPLVLESPESAGPGQPEIPGIHVISNGIHVIYDLSRLIAPGTHVPDQTVPVAPPDMAWIENLLEKRAKKIAQPEEGLSDTPSVDVLKFRLAYREYAIEMQHIREVILTGEITPVPGTPEYISGICVVRGEIISLVDLRVLLSIPEKGLTDLNRVIVLSDNLLSFGILADHITGIGTIEMSRISSPNTVTIPVKSDYVKGVVDGSLIVLDTAALFADPKMIIEDI